MITINKPQEVPEILQTKGKEKLAEMCDAFEKGERKFEFDKEIYGHQKVKQKLYEIHHEKCVFCETKFTHDSRGDVEHFRPKSLYFWLAYEWHNLFLSCEECNRTYKRNNFPLINSAERAVSYQDDVNNEQPLFLHPTEEVERFISFRGEVVFAIDDNERGKATIDGVGLNREKLEFDRKNQLEVLRLLYLIANANPVLPESKEAFAYLQERTTEKCEYSAMVKAALKVGFQY